MEEAADRNIFHAKLNSDQVVSSQNEELTDKNGSLLGAKKSLNSYILSPPQTKVLIELLAFPPLTKWELLYSATRDGFGAGEFHSRCNDKSPTLTIIKSENGSIFGGYTEATWDENCGSKKDLNAFVFSLVHQKLEPFKAFCSSIVGFDNQGPSFGSVNYNRIFIPGNSNGGDFSYIKFPNVVTGTRFYEKFKVFDIETFQRVI